MYIKRAVFRMGLFVCVGWVKIHAIAAYLITVSIISQFVDYLGLFPRQRNNNERRFLVARSILVITFGHKSCRFTEDRCRLNAPVERIALQLILVLKNGDS